ncbi:E3 ubiquitin-protein ligase UBR5 [Aphelenchoides fujianensis]|nr:E3 ubiquitin-protein ligase UBR5 [Aphelenchoides fujianensis]
MPRGEDEKRAAAPLGRSAPFDSTAARGPLERRKWKNPALYKSRLCDSWVAGVECRFGPHCWFAHGPTEQRAVPFLADNPTAHTMALAQTLQRLPDHARRTDYGHTAKEAFTHAFVRTFAPLVFAHLPADRTPPMLGTDHKELLLFGRVLDETDGEELVQRMADAGADRNVNGARPTAALAHVAADEIRQLAVGERHVGFLFADGRVARLGFHVVSSVKAEPPDEPPPAPAADGPPPPTRARMQLGPNGIVRLLGVSGGAAEERAALLQVLAPHRNPPAPVDVPEELVAQAQVVLTETTRDVIVRELQATRLNLNQAVNNILTRGARTEADDYPPPRDYELLEDVADELALEYQRRVRYMTEQARASRQDAAPPAAAAPAVDGQKTAALPAQSVKFEEQLEWWEGARRFTKIGATFSALLAVGVDGRLYAWRWGEKPTERRLPINATWFKEDRKEKIVELATCAWRAAVLTDRQRVASFLDEHCGPSACRHSNTSLLALPEGAAGRKLVVCRSHAAVLTDDQRLFWWGVMPVGARVCAFRRLRDSPKTEGELKVGDEVRTTTIPAQASGSVGLRFDDTTGLPQIGILQEDVWGVDETARFRVFSPADYELHAAETSDPPADRKPHDVRPSEAAWKLRDVVFFRSAPVAEVAVVKIIDGERVGVVFRSAVERAQREGPVDELRLLTENLRLLATSSVTRVDVEPDAEFAVPSLQSELAEVELPNSARRPARIVSLATEDGVIVLLVQKAGGELEWLETNLDGVELNRRPLRHHADALLCPDGRLESFGDRDLLLLQDAGGSLVPLATDDGAGFHSSPYLQLPLTPLVAVGEWHLQPAEVHTRTLASRQTPAHATLKQKDVMREARRLSVAVVLATSDRRHARPPIGPLLSAVQHCQLDAVRWILQHLGAAGNEEEARRQLLDARTDGNRNIFHTAVQHSTAASNREQADDFAGALQRLEEDLIQLSNDEERHFELPKDPKERQKNAIRIVSALAAHPTVRPHFRRLMTERDVHGHTPFYAAECCTITWTGETHFPQSTFRCRTCDLMDEQCCCAPCALSCHRGHDLVANPLLSCFCDCWTKGACRAGVAGNQKQRELLLAALLDEPRLLGRPNGDGEHAFLFLIELAEQQQPGQGVHARRGRSSRPRPSDLRPPAVDQKPPQFAAHALRLLMGRWTAVRSFLQFGVDTPLAETPVDAAAFFRSGQTSAVQLDRFVFKLLTKMPETLLDVLLNTLLRADKQAAEPTAHELIGRFVRSVVRVFVLFALAAPVFATSTFRQLAKTLAGDASTPRSLVTSAGHKEKLPGSNRRPAGLAAHAQEATVERIHAIALKCRRVFQVLPVHAMPELLNAAVALIAPLRLGVASALEQPADATLAGDLFGRIERLLFADQPEGAKKATSKPPTEQPTNQTGRREGALEDMDAHPPPPFFVYERENEAPNAAFQLDVREPAGREDSVTLNAVRERERDQEAEREREGDGEGRGEDETITSDDSFHEDEEEEEDADMRWGNERPEDEGEWPSRDYLTEPDEDDEEPDGEVIFRRVMARESRHTAVRSGGQPLPRRRASGGGRPVEPNARIALVSRPAGKPNGALREWPRVDKAADIAARFSKVMAERLQETAAWFERLMDRTESRVRLALALDPDDLPQLREADTKEHPLDSLAYCLDLMREHTSEAAGVSPAFDTEVLRPLCPLADCFLRHARVEEKLAEKKKAPKQEGADESLRRFFRRSPSLCDPLETCERNRAAFALAADAALPLVRRSALLTADAQPAELFGVPEETRTVEEHSKLERKRGIEHPRCLGWSDPPVRLVFKKSQQTAGAERDEPTDCRTDVEVVGEWPAERRSAAEIFARRWPAAFRLLASLFEEDVLAELAGDLCDSPLLARFASFALKQKVLAEMMVAYTSRFNENLSLERMPRDPHLLLARVFDALQQRFTAHMISGGHHSTRRSAFAARKVVVSFSDEPGEGSGVFRSFLVAVADALGRMEHLPMDREGTRAKQPPAVPPASPEDAEEQWDVNYRLVELPSGRLEFVSRVPSGRRKETDNSIRFEFVRHPPRHEPPAQQPADENAAEESPAKGEDAKRRRMADKFFAFTREHFPDHAKQIAGFFANGGLSTQQKMQLLMSPDLMRDCGRALHGFLRQNGEPDYSVRREYGPLFRRTPAGFLAPVGGSNSPHRLLAFRNVGRLIGIALQHGELLPLPLARHVLKFVLGRPVGWFDLAFADPVLFDSLRNVAWDEAEAGPQTAAFFDQMDLSFVAQLRREEGGGLAELEPRGAERPVDRENVLEYVRLFVEHRLLGDNRRALEAIRQGVEDVLPADALAHLSPEDLRLVLCGPERVNTRLLRSLCLFVDESSSTPYQLQAYKEWVFEAIEQLDEAQKQDLLHFWTGTPALSPTTTPRPTVLIRPADDRLPTANTCISRLSIPFYNSKETLRLKLTAAIQSREFGFI